MTHDYGPKLTVLEEVSGATICCDPHGRFA